MVNQRPILIAAPPRSGTTMLAGLLHKHGVWVGNARKTWFKGSNSDFGSENQDIKAIMKREAGKINYKNWTVPLPNYLNQGEKEVIRIKEEIESFVPGNSLWLVKTSWTLVFCAFWSQAYPNTKWVFPIRSPLSILNSMNRHPRMCKRPYSMKKNFIRALKNRQREVSQGVRNFLFIDVCKIANKDTNELDKLFTYLKIPISWQTVDDWIKPKMMKA